MAAIRRGYAASTNFIAHGPAATSLVDAPDPGRRPAVDQLVTVYKRLSSAESYRCMPICQRRVTLATATSYRHA